MSPLLIVICGTVLLMGFTLGEPWKPKWFWWPARAIVFVLCVLGISMLTGCSSVGRPPPYERFNISPCDGPCTAASLPDAGAQGGAAGAPAAGDGAAGMPPAAGSGGDSGAQTGGSGGETVDAGGQTGGSGGEPVDAGQPDTGPHPLEAMFPGLCMPCTIDYDTREDSCMPGFTFGHRDLICYCPGAPRRMFAEPGYVCEGYCGVGPESGQVCPPDFEIPPENIEVITTPCIPTDPGC